MSTKTIGQYSSMSWENAAYPAAEERDLFDREAECREVEDTAQSGKTYKKILVKSKGRIISIFPSVARALADIIANQPPEVKNVPIVWGVSVDGKSIMPFLVTKKV